MKTIFYARVSCSDQTVEHQRAQAEAAGFRFDEVITDHGVSGVHTRLIERPQGRRLFDLLRKGDVLVCRWLDRLGRDYQDVCDTLRELMRRGVVVKTVINGLVFDGAAHDVMHAAVRDALIAFMAAMAQAQAEATKEAQRAGIEHAKRNGAYLGRKPSYDRQTFDLARALLLDQNYGATEVSRATGLSRQTLYRIKADPKSAESALQAWGM
ncbi:MAG: recombinase family protein [Fimbriimonadaceae bacterium]|nr:recombinase family protein [Fimbriimonadaceae bacterium]